MSEYFSYILMPLQKEAQSNKVIIFCHKNNLSFISRSNAVCRFIPGRL